MRVGVLSLAVVVAFAIPAAAMVNEDGSSPCPEPAEGEEPTYCIMDETDGSTDPPAGEDMDDGHGGHGDHGGGGCVEDAVSATPDGQGGIALKWLHVENATSLELMVETIGASPMVLPPLDPHATEFLFKHTEPGTLYIFTLSATLGSGATASYCPVSVTTPAEVPFFTGPMALGLALAGIVGAGFVLRRK